MVGSERTLQEEIMNQLVKEESLGLARRDPTYRRERQFEEIVTRLILEMKGRGIHSFDRYKIHDAFWFTLFRLSMEGMDLREFMIFRDCVTGRFEKLTTALSEQVGILLRSEVGGGRDDHYHINDVSKRAEYRLLDPSYFQDYEVTRVMCAVRFGVSAYTKKLVPEEVLKTAGLL